MVVTLLLGMIVITFSCLSQFGKGCLFLGQMRLTLLMMKLPVMELKRVPVHCDGYLQSYPDIANGLRKHSEMQLASASHSVTFAL